MKRHSHSFFTPLYQAKEQVWDKIFQEPLRDRSNQYLMIDSTIVRAQQ